MATFIRTPRGDWKALIRRRGWPASCKTFRLKSDAQDWARIAEDEMWGTYLNARADRIRGLAHRLRTEVRSHHLPPSCENPRLPGDHDQPC